MQTPEDKIKECYRVLGKAGSNIVWEILRQSDKFYQWDHYPKGDVYDSETHCQYYYHAHNPEASDRLPEHGHFHIFIRKPGIPKKIKAATLPTAWQVPDNTQELCHLIAIAMDDKGFPIRLFTVNRWVTAESWYHAKDVIKLLDLFAIDHTWPSWPTNIWLTEMVKIHKLTIIELIKKRDKALKAWQKKYPNVNPYEDRNLEILSCRNL
ncbi:MAG: hypothetical protein A3E87_06355 [Gammaproteobacteria bacterium RIFCSPHIGHO2_12_FULL_35_23]|nr:MAG: hypothetical protein A3E87_06355 [Gammaproteobacteria bacterium RIFCSPHIGHO2_12_FULL_35_23]